MDGNSFPYSLWLGSAVCFFLLSIDFLGLAPVFRFNFHGFCFDFVCYRWFLKLLWMKLNLMSHWKCDTSIFDLKSFQWKLMKCKNWRIKPKPVWNQKKNFSIKAKKKRLMNLKQRRFSFNETKQFLQFPFPFNLAIFPISYSSST